jgi:hypothetical protein
VLDAKPAASSSKVATSRTGGGTGGTVTTLAEINPASDWCQRCGPGRRHTWVHRRDGGFNKDRYSVEMIDLPSASTFVETFHYSGEYARRDDTKPSLVGVMVLSNPQNIKVLTNVFPNLEPLKASAELGRFVLLDSVPGNAETHFLAQGFEIAAAAGICGVVSFADPVPRATADGKIVFTGHVGAIYREKGAQYAGRSTPGWMTLLPDGTSLSNRSLQKVRGNEQGHGGVERRLEAYGALPRQAGDDDGGAWLKRELRRIGARRVKHPGKHRYVFRLGKTRAQRRRVFVAMPARPYPRRPDGPMSAASIAAVGGQEPLFNVADVLCSPAAATRLGRTAAPANAP